MTKEIGNTCRKVGGTISSKSKYGGENQWRCRAWHRWGHGGGSWGAYEHGHAHTCTWWVYIQTWETSRHNP